MLTLEKSKTLTLIALSSYLHQIKKQKEDIFLYRGEIIQLFKQGNYKAALRLYENKFDLMLRYEDNIAIAYHGIILYHLGYYQESIKDFSIALNFSKEKAHIATLLTNRGLSYFSIQDYEKALVDFEHSLRVDPNMIITVRYKNKTIEKLSLSSTSEKIPSENKLITYQYEYDKNIRNSLHNPLKEQNSKPKDTKKRGEK